MDYKNSNKFIEWIKVKIKIHFSQNNAYFRDGEMWWANLGLNIGYEQDGKNEDFERPVLVLRKFNIHMLWAIPLSTKIKDNSPFYFQYEFRGIKYSALLSQLRLISSKRLCRKIGMFPAEEYMRVKIKVKLLV